ncbi:MAG: hypothetical protein A2287_02685 [Candidatus Melainabacteria bacterium RIFOXYA12_FULL_32_12]|nr:MAG: hypothetical protein A2104_00375 [Candidatus Melainabacteria bacterium GWF2_32_7]OGI18130.1 MAG: hypothetical protein A2255_10965 [Candidatus Melainabacteria bacterium RIFOXYA2_FULL_32_9]OGI26112.1 MAG: hypothetical protein A2287_02685 [Candidatus Melainabacteria bacterium RIFOXYA12_FULL_32_12]
MRVFKKFLTMLAVVSVIGFSGLASYAEVAIVDLDKVISNYSKAQDVSADLKVKEAELQKFLADAQKQLKNANSPVEKKNLEDRLTNEFKTKADGFRELQIKEWKEIEDSVFSAIDKAAKSKKLDLVLNKSSVLQGGVDITDQIINLLNKK